MAEQILAESLPAGVDDRTWGVLTALSNSAKQRAQGHHILLNAPEHVLGRAVREAACMFDSASISGRHCRIYRKDLPDESPGVFIKDSSSNGTFVNGVRLRKDSPELRIQQGDIISLAAHHEHATENGFAYVFRDTSSGCLKRKQENEAGKPDDSKRMRTAADGPVSLADVRRLERSNQELRQKLESECYKSENLNADLRAAKSSADNMVKEALDQCRSEYMEKMEILQVQLSAKAAASDESSGKCAQMESTIEDLNNRLIAAAQSRTEAEEALRNIKSNREELEKQIERERNQWKQARDEAELLHKSAVDRVRAEAAEELKRQAEVSSRQLKQLEDELAAQQESKEVYRAQIDNLTKRLEEERVIRMDSEKKGQELQILLNNEQRACFTLTKDMKNVKDELQKAYENFRLCQMERDAVNSKLMALQLEKEDILSKLTLEKQRFEGARDRITLRETQLRAFQTTAEAISVLQQKQQEQLKAMMKTLADDDAEYANAAENNDEGEDKDDIAKDMEMTQPNGTQEMQEADMDVYAETQIDDLAQEPTTQVVATQIEPTQVVATQEVQDGDMAATQLEDERQAMETQLVAKAEPGIETDAEADIGTQLAEAGTRMQLAPSQERVNRSGGRASLCTADLLASETVGSWVDDTPPDEMDDERRESEVGNSDSLPIRRLTNPASAFNNTMASQNSPKLNLNNVPRFVDTDDDGSDTEEEVLL